MWPRQQQPPDTTVYGQEKLPIPLQELRGEMGHVPAPRGALACGHSGLSPTPSLAAAGPLASIVLHPPDPPCCPCTHCGPCSWEHLPRFGHPQSHWAERAARRSWLYPDVILCFLFLQGCVFGQQQNGGCCKMSPLAQRSWRSAVRTPCEAQSGGLARLSATPNPSGQVSRR